MTFGPFKVDPAVMSALYGQGWFREPGAYVVVDGQFGSTGKGLACSLLAGYALNHHERMPDWIVSNAGPNSGHTAVVHEHGDQGQRTWVNMQVPIVSSILSHYFHPRPTWLNGGAVVAPKTLANELGELSVQAYEDFRIHPHAAVITDATVEANKRLTARIASTGKGTQPAAALRILRENAVYQDLQGGEVDAFVPVRGWPKSEAHPDFTGLTVLIETSQGMSLGINSGFYPFCTHRECTVAQALSDARMSPRHLRRTMMVVRTYPIRVGNTEGSSGPCYPDQREVTWEEIGQTPEITTVTKRVRRVFTWSRQQFREGLRVNWPDTILLNFMNYIQLNAHPAFLRTVREDIQAVMGHSEPLLLIGIGPAAHNVLLPSY